jgi:hypothetical protein
MRYEIIFDGRLVRTSGSIGRDEVESFMDLFVEELEGIQAEDIDVSTNLQKCTVTVSVTTEDEDMLEAQIKGSSTIRTAFHAAGAATPGWSIDWTSARTLPEADNHPEPAHA